MSNTNLSESLQAINDLVEPVIEQLLTADVEESNKELALYQCAVGGKRIRPALVVLGGQVFGADINTLIYPAASIEVLHNATLIIDDIIDHSESRRDKPTLWRRYGTSIAECISFTYLASVFAGLLEANNGLRLIDLYSKTIKIIIDGEIKDILFERSGRDDEAYIVANRFKTISTDDYFKMIGQKTAILLQTCCQAGAICAAASAEQVELIGNFGFNLGMAFQIRDDVLDIFGDEKKFGKKIGKDIIEKKMGNYVILSAIDQLASDDKSVIINILNSTDDISENDITNVTDLIKKTDARRQAEYMADTYIQKAYIALANLPANEFSIKLKEIAQYVIERDE